MAAFKAARPSYKIATEDDITLANLEVPAVWSPICIS